MKCCNIPTNWEEYEPPSMNILCSFELFESEDLGDFIAKFGSNLGDTKVNEFLLSYFFGVHEGSILCLFLTI